VDPGSRVFAGWSLHNQLRVPVIKRLITFVVIGSLEQLIVICPLISIGLAHSRLILNHQGEGLFQVDTICDIKRLQFL
jgi:hypothetical protein